jgi:transporter family protein
MSWIVFAMLSAVAAAFTAVLAKLGVEGVPSTLAMAIRTVVVVVLAWAIVMTLGEQRALAGLSRRTWIYLVASGIATGVSWWAYFRALQLAPASWVAPIDKLSLPLTVLLAALWLRESVSWTAYVGVMLMVVGALLTRA